MEDLKISSIELSKCLKSGGVEIYDANNDNFIWLDKLEVEQLKQWINKHFDGNIEKK